MRIRTITTGIEFVDAHDFKLLENAAIFNKKASQVFENNGFEVETVRISTNPFEEYVRKSDNAEILSIFKDFSDFCIDSKIQFISIGEISNPLYACNI
ncbi:MAG: DUF711 family protein, partial [Planctomycetes bacterium]|nr:DUF711 family protein [Planctomycetota bacterium]